MELETRLIAIQDKAGPAGKSYLAELLLGSTA
jgi:hypothetical protein